MLIIEEGPLAVPADLLQLLSGELEKIGLLDGTLSIGEITAAPEMLYFLWFEKGEPPVTMLLRREFLTTQEGVREAVHGFATKWQRRLH